MLVHNIINKHTHINKRSKWIFLLTIIFIPFNIIPRYSCQKNLICQRIPNLNEQQLKICRQSPEILTVIRKGIQLALKECQQLFQQKEHLHPAWNCSSFIHNSLNRLYVNITDADVKGTKEASFAHALFTAAVVYTLSEACTKSNFPYCSCYTPSKLNEDNNNYYYQTLSDQPPDSKTALNKEWKWNGCVHNIHFGVETARLFLDSSEHQVWSPYSLLNLHNNNVGRKIIKDSLILRCQCHGFSGSCTFRTCWHTMKGFPQATQLLYKRYTNAKLVSLAWLNKSYRNRIERKFRKNPVKLTRIQQYMKQAFTNVTRFEFNQPTIISRDSNSIKTSKRDLIYLKPTINHCQYSKRQVLSFTNNLKSNNKSIPCSINNTFEQQWPPIESCGELCCGKGFRPKTLIKTDQCNCVFHFCCSIKCKFCSTNVTIFECIHDTVKTNNQIDYL